MVVILEQMNEVVYLGSVFSRDGRYEMNVERRITVGNRVKGALAETAKRQYSCTFGRTQFVLVRTPLYGNETWVLQKKNERMLWK